MPSTLKRRCRQSLRLDQCSRQILASKLNVACMPLPSSEFVPSSPKCSPSRSICSGTRQRSRHRTRSICKSPTFRFFRRKSNASLRYGGSGAFLPVELLLRIFALGVEQDVEFSVTISQVCSHWRKIAIKTPSLWCRVRLDGRWTLCYKRIRRSSGQPLDVELDFSAPIPARIPAIITYAHLRMACALPSIGQWRSLSIRFGGYIPFFWNSVLSSLCAEPARVSPSTPGLQSLSLVYPLNDDTKDLRHVSLHGIRLRWTAPLFGDLVCLEYTHHGFTEGHEAVQEVLAMLTVSRRLESLAIAFPEYPASRSGIPYIWFSRTYLPVSMNHLKRFTLRANGDAAPPKELRKLVAKLLLPALRQLELDAAAVAFSRKAVRSVVKSFRGHPNIERLIVRNGWNHHRCIGAFVRSLTSLRVFETCISSSA
ncbi:hypothetical protein DFH11DRAFT_1593730 [Phellopilus nigrolimitatus]|nr:hypothetical protein DFH11DRAFT_1593730 [Phellopilus nigrolimitatus]